MIAGGDAIDASFVKLAADLGGDAEPRRRVLAVDRHEIETELAPEPRDLLDHRIPAGTTDDVAAKQNFHALDKGASAPVGQHPIEALVVRPTGHIVGNELSIEADADRRHLAPRPEAKERAIVEAAAIAQPPPPVLAGQQGSDQLIE